MEKSDKKEKWPLSDSEILEQGLAQFDLCYEDDQKNREEAIDDLEFRSGKQWPDDVENARKINHRPCLTINKMPQFERQIINDQKQNQPAVKVSPVDDFADVETAKIRQGLIRSIENQSDAEEAYDQAFTSAVRCGLGFFRIYSEYEHERSFDQVLKIGKIDNPLNVWLDPYSCKLDGSDARYGFVNTKMSRDEFEAEYGESELAKHEDWKAMAGRQGGGWLSADECRICEYFFKHEERAKLIQLDNGEVYFEDELKNMEKDEDGDYFVYETRFDEATQMDIEIKVSFKIANERWSKRCKVYWVKMNAIEVLEKTVWPGQYIPIVPVYGDVINIDGRVVRESLIRHGKDSQRMVNFWASNEAELINLSPKSPWIGYEGQFEGHENKWNSAHIMNYTYLEVKPTMLEDGSMAPMPQRNQFEPPVQAVTQARMLAGEDMKETVGVPDAARGLTADENSGIAIQRRVNQGLTANFHLVDNLNKSIRHAGRILNDAIPYIYDAPRTIRTLGEQNDETMVRINEELNLQENQKRPYDFSVGRYDVSISTGPNYETKRQEARETMIELIRFNPQFAAICSDLVVKNMDFPGSDEFAERIRKTMDPKLLEQSNDEIPPQVQAELEKMGQMVEQLTMQLNEAQDMIEKDTLKIQSDERIAAMKVKADLQKEQMKIEGEESLALLKQEIEVMNRRIEQLTQPQQEF